METMKRIEESILFFEDIDLDLEDGVPRVVRDFQKGEFMEIVNSPDCEEIFADVLSASLDEPLDELLEKGAQQFLDKSGSDHKEAVRVLCVGAAALCAWLQRAQCGPAPAAEGEEGGAVRWLGGRGREAAARAALERAAGGDAAPGARLPHPPLLLLAAAALRPCAAHPLLQTGRWWCARALWAWQRALREPSPALHARLAALLEDGPPGPLRGEAWLWLEAAGAHLCFGHLRPARAALDAAARAAGLAGLALVGALGKRTRFQQKDLAQLTLKVEVDDSSPQTPLLISDSLPKDLRLDDDVRLEKVQFTGDGAPTLPPLSPVQQAVVLNTFILVQRSQPHDELAHEELLPYLQVVLSEPQLWSVQAAALVLRSRLESKQRRTAERAMSQLEEVVNALKGPMPGVRARLRGLLATPLPLLADVQCDLAHALVQLGCVQSALDIFLHLRQWEAAVTCYTLLDLRHQAAELLKRELAVQETVPLLCLLGDATDDISQYERAWELSAQRSARAQRHWAMHHFRRKEYEESIPHLELSLQCNSLQPELWRRLGYAALDTENWQLCAKAYRRCVELDPENMEGWNNLAKAYVKTGQKARAWHALQEALKADFENWRLWDNVAAVSADVGAFDEVVRAYHRLLDLQSGRHVDIPVLQTLVRAITSEVKDSEGQNASRMRPQALALFGRITSQVTTDPEVWQLYAELTASLPEQTPQTLERTAQYLQRAHRAATQKQGWARDRNTCQKTLSLSSHLADAYLTCCRVQPEPQRLLSSARLSLKSVLAAVRQQVEVAAELSSDVEELQVKLDAVESAIEVLRAQ
ncbi:hypothetical protein R5R35_010306 [Gryllus longicercus]|uniref:Tetratricopeptide repeat protein 27 n=2 Tax=Gryllus longicercus TaxID=2509291 RepID=A0AAN9V5T5_9ORTH